MERKELEAVSSVGGAESGDGARSRRGKAVGVDRRKETELGSKLRSEEGELLSGTGTRRRAQRRTRGLSGDHRWRRGRSGGHSQEEFAGASAVQSAH